MNIRSCELQTHLYAIEPHYCTKDTEQTGREILRHSSFIERCSS